MQASAKEVKIDVCFNHRKINLHDAKYEGKYSAYTFSDQIFFPPRTCGISGCAVSAYYTLIGVVVPDAVGALVREDEVLSVFHEEIFTEAQVLLGGGSALERLCYYIRTRIVPSQHREFLAEKLIRHHAKMILQKLKIDPECSLSDKDKHCILRELSLYPEDDNDH